MYVTLLRLELRMLDHPSPRQKRRRVRAIVTKLRQHFNVSVAELTEANDPQTLVLGAAAVGRSRREARAVLDRVADAAGAYPHAVLIHHALQEV